jgi:superfamily II DNA/RNA helicase
LKTIIFAETKRDVQKLSDELSSRGFNTGSLHGDKRHRERVRILDDFKKNKISILVATDVAARGLDVPDITHVINYEIPKNYETYIHRVGRTGRANKRGFAFTFVS